MPKVKAKSPASNSRHSAKLAYKKKQRGTKFRNDQLRESLDLQAQSVYVTQSPTPTAQDASRLQKDSVNDLLNSFNNL